MESVGEVPGAPSSAPPDVPAQGERLKRAGCMEWVRRKPLSMRSVIVAEELECVSPKRGVFTACDPGVFFVVGVPVISGCGGGCVLRAGWNHVVAPRIGDGGVDATVILMRCALMQRGPDATFPDATCPDTSCPNVHAGGASSSTTLAIPITNIVPAGLRMLLQHALMQCALSV